MTQESFLDPAPQWVACVYPNAIARRTYTYEYRGRDPIAPGDVVQVPDPRQSDKLQFAIVHHLEPDRPPFACKRIRHKVYPDRIPEFVAKAADDLLRELAR